MENNPFPLTSKVNELRVCGVLDAPEADIVNAAFEVAELAKWIIAHAKVDDNGNVYIRFMFNNPQRLPHELLLLKAMRANPL